MVAISIASSTLIGTLGSLEDTPFITLVTPFTPRTTLSILGR